MDLLVKDWDRTPYVYVIGWQWLGLYYIGCQYGEGVHPDDLMVTYRTSSKQVHAILDKHGLPDIVWFQKVNTATDALAFERMLILLSNALHNPKFINKGVFGDHLECPSTDREIRTQISRTMRGRPKTIATRRNMTLAQLKRASIPIQDVLRVYKEHNYNAIQASLALGKSRRYVTRRLLVMERITGIRFPRAFNKFTTSYKQASLPIEEAEI